MLKTPRRGKTIYIGIYYMLYDSFLFESGNTVQYGSSTYVRTGASWLHRVRTLKMKLPLKTNYPNNSKTVVSSHENP
jgi:hypothetical protein